MQPLVDAYQREITYMRVSITDRCNLRCVYCMPEEGLDWTPTDELLTYDELLRIITVAARRGLRKIRVTGGEPLVRKGVVEFIDRLNRVPGIEEIALTTNAVFLKDMAADLFKAGLRGINISIDSLNPDTFAKIVRRDIFDKVWEGIEEAERVGFTPLKLNVVLQQGVNDHEAIDFVNITRTKPYHVRFIEYMPCANWDTWVKAYKPFQAVVDEIETLTGKMIPINGANEGNTGPAENFRIPGAPGIVGFIHAVSHDFCDTCNRVRLTANGQIRPCLFSEIAVDFRNALRNGCSDEEIEGLLAQVLYVKPEYHELDMIPEEKKLTTMVNLGG
ncbi:MAG: GTP 3',8-cyclase MoaA [Nitrospira sp.]|nr:GTP 3',8-cyclase MoaA [Candidatus Manganitrophaceae bacterium]HIL34618.1 GTP 3',8-cyclase MoaA [Candidatus Manganitrophaceae bacterium]